MQRKKIAEAMKNVYFQKMTPNGYHEIEQEIAKLQEQRPTKIAQLKAARALGDLSENTEYSTAKRELRHLESRLRYLNKQLQYSQVIKPMGRPLTSVPRLPSVLMTTMKSLTIKLSVRWKPTLLSKRFPLTPHWGRPSFTTGLVKQSPSRLHRLAIR